jgi:hypothetical protein
LKSRSVKKWKFTCAGLFVSSPGPRRRDPLLRTLRGGRFLRLPDPGFYQSRRHAAQVRTRCLSAMPLSPPPAVVSERWARNPPDAAGRDATSAPGRLSASQLCSLLPPPLLSPAAPSGRTRRRVAGTLPLEVEVSLIAMEDEVSGAAVLRCSWTFSSPYIYLVCCLVLLSSLLQTLCSTRHCP